jgi:hypothetical protein
MPPAKKNAPPRVKVSGEDNMYTDGQGKYWTIMEGEFLECFPSGNLKDQETEKFKCHYGRAFRKEKLTPEQEKQLDDAIDRKMREAFPNSPYRDGRIPLVHVDTNSRRKK